MSSSDEYYTVEGTHTEYYTVEGSHKDEHIWCGSITPKVFHTVPENWWEDSSGGGFWIKNSFRWCWPKETQWTKVRFTLSAALVFIPRWIGAEPPAVHNVGIYDAYGNLVMLCDMLGSNRD